MGTRFLQHLHGHCGNSVFHSGKQHCEKGWLNKNFLGTISGRQLLGLEGPLSSSAHCSSRRPGSHWATHNSGNTPPLTTVGACTHVYIKHTGNTPPLTSVGACTHGYIKHTHNTCTWSTVKFLKRSMPGMVAHTFDPSPGEVKASGSPWVQCQQPGLDRELWANQSSTVRPCLNNNSKDTQPFL